MHFCYSQHENEFKVYENSIFNEDKIYYDKNKDYKVLTFTNAEYLDIFLDNYIVYYDYSNKDKRLLKIYNIRKKLTKTIEENSPEIAEYIKTDCNYGEHEFLYKIGNDFCIIKIDFETTDEYYNDKAFIYETNEQYIAEYENIFKEKNLYDYVNKVTYIRYNVDIDNLSKMESKRYSNIVFDNIYFENLNVDYYPTRLRFKDSTFITKIEYYIIYKKKDHLYFFQIDRNIIIDFGKYDYLDYCIDDDVDDFTECSKDYFILSKGKNFYLFVFEMDLYDLKNIIVIKNKKYIDSFDYWIYIVYDNEDKLQILKNNNGNIEILKTYENGERYEGKKYLKEYSKIFYVINYKLNDEIYEEKLEI